VKESYIDKSRTLETHEAHESKTGTSLRYTNCMNRMKIMKAKPEQVQAGGEATAN
jgi:hypothetical protein